MLVPEDSGEAVPTQRAIIEARKEKKVMEMLSRDVPMSPAAVTFEDMPETLTYDSATSIAKKPAGSTSPKKRFLGLNIPMPGFMSGNTEVAAVSSNSDMPPPPTPLLPPPPPALKRQANPVTGVRRRGLTAGEQQQEEATSHLPSKVRQLRNLFDDDALVDDLVLPGYPPNNPVPRSVSDGVTSTLQKKTSEKNMRAAVDDIKRSKSVVRSRDTDSETIPPTPPAKNTPPKVLVNEQTPVKASQKDFISTLQAEDDDPTPIKGVQHLRTDYHDLIQKAPSMYSLHGDIQHFSGSQSAGMLGYSLRKNGDDDSPILPPTVYEGRWSEGQLPTRKRQDKQEQHKPQLSPPRKTAAPVHYSPSVYSVAWSPDDTKKYHQQVRVVPVFA